MPEQIPHGTPLLALVRHLHAAHYDAIGRNVYLPLYSRDYAEENPLTSDVLYQSTGSDYLVNGRQRERPIT
ncbi:MAG TPA: hypothetical protein VGG25_11830 [Streptosporangiaceae bacterium]